MCVILLQLFCIPFCMFCYVLILINGCTIHSCVRTSMSSKHELMRELTHYFASAINSACTLNEMEDLPCSEIEIFRLPNPLPF